MKFLKEKLTDFVVEAFVKCSFDKQYGIVIESNRPDMCQFQCNGALAAAQQYKLRPNEIAQQVVNVLMDSEIFQSATVAEPGYINLIVNDAFLISHVEEMMRSEYFGCRQQSTSQSIVIDFGGANIAKPLHVGHLRAAIIGESLKRISRFLGHTVLGDIHLGDWGLQMGMIISEIERRQPNLPYFNSNYNDPFPTASPVTLTDLEEIYPMVSEQAKTDEEIMRAAKQATYELQQGKAGYKALWQNIRNMSIADLQNDYANLNVDYDLWLGESDTEPRIPGLIKKLQDGGWAYESQGAIIVDVTKPEDKKEVPPFILVKSDGAVLYSTTDLATIEQRVQDYSPDVILYVVDKRQAEHFRQVFRCAYKTGIAPISLNLEHIAFGTMNGNDGKPFKTRAGGVLKLKDLIQMITDKALEKMEKNDLAKDHSEEERINIARSVGLATLKFADLMNHYSRNYVFDLDRFSSFDGYTGPYLLYTCVRIKSILRKAKVEDFKSSDILNPKSDVERALLLKIAEFPEVVNLAFEKRGPNYLCEYVYSLASLFTSFYHKHHILSEENSLQQKSWLSIAYFSLKIIELNIDFLGMSSVEKM